LKRMFAAVFLLLLLLFLLPLLLLSSGSNGAAPTATLPADAAPPPTLAGAFSDAATQLRVLTDDGVSVVSMDKYLFRVVAAEMPASFQPEALKAQAIAARTYALYKMRNGPSKRHPEADLCTDSSCCSAFVTEETAQKNWGSKSDEYTKKIQQAISETDGQAILYEGEPINAVFHSSSSGATESAALVWGASVPYLSSVASPENGDTVPNYQSTVELSAESFRSAVLNEYPQADFSGTPEQWIGTPSCSGAGKVLSVPVGGVTVTGRSLRSLFGLRSTAFSVSVKENTVVFSVTGYGHGVGMSQYGANEYAARGWSCRKILTWYYHGTVIGAWKASSSDAPYQKNA
jgi:stage II sporulation protein D